MQALNTAMRDKLVYARLIISWRPCVMVDGAGLTTIACSSNRRHWIRLSSGAPCTQVWWLKRSWLNGLVAAHFTLSARSATTLPPSTVPWPTSSSLPAQRGQSCAHSRRPVGVTHQSVCHGIVVCVPTLTLERASSARLCMWQLLP